jgi:hypothetical protein
VTAEQWIVEFERRAEKDLERLDPQVKDRYSARSGGSLMIREAPTCEG